MLGQNTIIPEDPEELVLWVVDSTCNANNVAEFYLKIREMENAAIRYPPWPNSKATSH